MKNPPVILACFLLLFCFLAGIVSALELPKLKIPEKPKFELFKLFHKPYTLKLGPMTRMPVFRPRPDIDYKILRIYPEPSIDFKILRIGPKYRVQFVPKFEKFLHPPKSKKLPKLRIEKEPPLFQFPD